MADWEKTLRRIRPSMGPDQIKALLLRQLPMCAFCHRHLTPHKATIEHLEPRSQGGMGIVPNLVLACEPCNLAKGPRTPEQWCRSIQHAPQYRLEDVRHIFESPSDPTSLCIFCGRSERQLWRNPECVPRGMSVQELYLAMRSGPGAV